MNRVYLLFIVSLLVTSSLFAQTPQERQEIIRNYDLEKLSQLQEQFEVEYKAKKKEAVKYALRNNIEYKNKIKFLCYRQLIKNPLIFRNRLFKEIFRRVH